MNLLTTSQVAARLGKHKSTVLRHAAEHGLGVHAGPRTQRYFTADELERLRVLCREPGNPDFGPDFHRTISPTA